jgi:hypothetical protein
VVAACTVPHSETRLARAYASWEATFAPPAFLFGFGLWWLAWAGEAARNVPPALAGLPPVPVFDTGVPQLLAMLANVASAWGARAIGRRLRWPVAYWPGYATLAPLALGFVSAVGSGRHVMYTPDWAIWIVAIALHLRLLYLNDAARTTSALDAVLRASHVGGVWLATAMLADCLWVGIDRARLWQTAWAEVSFLTATVAILLGLTLWSGRAMSRPTSVLRWPLSRHHVDYCLVCRVANRRIGVRRLTADGGAITR